MTTQSTATTTEKQDGRTRDNPAHAVLKHLAKGSADLVKAAIREVTIERLESGAAVAGLAVLRSELFGANGGGAAGTTISHTATGGGEARAAASSSRKPKQMTLGEAARQPPKDDDEEVEEEEVEDEEDDEPGERTPLRRPVTRAAKGKKR